MISKPLFKQSIKANFVSFIVITVATCFMLAVLLTVVGRDSVNSVLSTLGETFAKDAVKSQIENVSMSQYYLTGMSAEGYDEAERSAIPLTDAYDYGVQLAGGNPSDEIKAYIIAGITQNITDARDKAAAEAILNAYASGGGGAVTQLLISTVADGVYTQLLETLTKEEADSIKEFITGGLTVYAAYKSESGLISANDLLQDFVVIALSAAMEEPLYEYGFTREKIAEISKDAIIGLRGQILIRYPAKGLSQLDAAEVNSLIGKLSSSLMDDFPDNVKESLADMQNLDLAELIVGSLFFKIAGLLLPLIFIITVCNSLIAGQVDSGSMAYVLSTPIKRKKVTITQMSFMIASLLLMCSLTTATGLICLAVIGASTISYSEMLLLNLGLFMTMLAFSGICFMVSAWFNRSKHSLALGGGVSMYFLVATILGLFGSPAMPGLIRMDSMNFFNYTTITSLFDNSSVLAGTTAYIWKFAVLALIGLTGYIIGIIKFNRKDLPL